MRAHCPECNCLTFFIEEDKVVCANCGAIFDFCFLDPPQNLLCETKACDIVKIINE